MSKRSIEVAIITRYGNGDESMRVVRKIPVPPYISKMRDADKKDVELAEHVEWLEEWINSAIATRERDDERAGVMDSW